MKTNRRGGIDVKAISAEAAIANAAAEHDIYEARYHTEMTVDADSATDEEWAAAYKAADHEATFATYEEAETFIREGKAAAGESFEGGHISKNGGIVKQVRAISPTLEEMSAKVTDLLSEIDDAKSKGSNAGARELERQLGKVHQNYYYSIVHFGVDISGEQFEFAFKHAVVEYSAKKEMARRNSEEYKAAVRAEAEYDAKKASAIIEANAGVRGIEYVAEVRRLLDKAILSKHIGDIVYYSEELKRCFGEMTTQTTTTKATTIITDAELTTKAAVVIDETPNSEKAATVSYIPCKGFSVNGDMFNSLKCGIEDWLENVICNDARAQLLVATRKRLIGIDGKPVRGKYSTDRVIVKFNIDSYNDFSGMVKGDNFGIKVAPSEEYFDPEYETQCKKIVTDWLDKNAGEYKEYQLRMEAKRRANKYYTEIPDWEHNGNRVPNSQREAIREYLEQLHAADETVDEHEGEMPNQATNDTLLEVRGAIFTHSSSTYHEMAEYLEEIAEYDAGDDQIDVCYEDDKMVDEFRSDYTPDEFVVGFEGRLLTSTLNLIKAKVASFDNLVGDSFVYSHHSAVLKYEAEPVEEEYDDDEYDDEEYESETPEPATPQIDSDATIATLGGLLVIALTALYNVSKATTPADDGALAEVEEPAAESACYVVRLYGYDAAFPNDPLYSKGNVRFDSLADAVNFAIDDKDKRGASKSYGGSMIDKDFTSGNTTGLITVMSITHTGEIEAYLPESRQLLEKLASTDEVTGVVELKISGAIAEDNVTFATHQPPLDIKPDYSIDSETPAAEATFFLKPTSDKAAVKDLSDTVLDLKVSADEIEELLASGYTLGDSGHTAIARAQELMKQALAELTKLKSIGTAA